MSQIRTVIVDDEPLARQRLRHLLREEGDFELVAECGDAGQALDAINSHAPDVVFLDVRMPERDGFGVLDGIDRDRRPSFVFVSAYEEYALRAFDVDAVDYLLKPVTRERFRQAAERARRIVTERQMQERPVMPRGGDGPGHAPHVERLLVRSAGRIVVVRVEDIDWIDGAGNYLKLHCGKSGYLLRHTLGGLEGRLNPRRFLRIHRSTIVNVERVAELQTSFSGEYVVVLKDGTRLAMSRGYRHKLDELTGEGRSLASQSQAH